MLDVALQRAVIACFPQCPIGIGNPKKAGCLLLRWGGPGFAPSKRYLGKGKDEMLVELIGVGRQTVMPPSMHPCGQPYHMADGGPVPCVEDLRELDQSHIDAMEKVLANYLGTHHAGASRQLPGSPPGRTPTQPSAIIRTPTTVCLREYDRIVAAVSEVPPGTITHEEHYPIVLGFNDLLLDGFDRELLWRTLNGWSALSGDATTSDGKKLKYIDSEVRAQFDAATPGDGIGIGSMFGIAATYKGKGLGPGTDWFQPIREWAIRENLLPDDGLPDPGDALEQKADQPTAEPAAEDFAESLEISAADMEAINATVALLAQLPPPLYDMVKKDQLKESRGSLHQELGYGLSNCHLQLRGSLAGFVNGAANLFLRGLQLSQH